MVRRRLVTHGQNPSPTVVFGRVHGEMDVCCSYRDLAAGNARQSVSLLGATAPNQQPIQQKHCLPTTAIKCAHRRRMSYGFRYRHVEAEYPTVGKVSSRGLAAEWTPRHCRDSDIECGQKAVACSVQNRSWMALSEKYPRKAASQNHGHGNLRPEHRGVFHENTMRTHRVGVEPVRASPTPLGETTYVQGLVGAS